MAMQASDIEALIRESFPEAKITITEVVCVDHDDVGRGS